MHRVRHSLPYFQEFGWEPVTLTVDPHYVEGYRDDLLLQTIPDDLSVERVRALDFRWTRFIGLGSLALRSLPFLAIRGNELLSHGSFDLVYFSTTAFPVLSLGPYWKRKFDIPFVVDMQDPWFNDYYEARPRAERPRKYWFSHRLDRLLEPRVLPHAAGLIAVTSAYIEELQSRYPRLKDVVSLELPFAASPVDMDVAKRLVASDLPGNGSDLIGTYTGVCNTAMVPILEVVLASLKLGLEEHPDLFSRVMLRFVGTNYAPENVARPVVLPIAQRIGVLEHVSEQTSRVSYFEALRLQHDSSFLMLPGTLDSGYTASKLYPYVMARRPVLAVVNARSSVVDVLRQTRVGEPVTFTGESDLRQMVHTIKERWAQLLEKLPFEPDTDWQAFEQYHAREMTRRQVEIFDKVVGS